MEGPGWGAHVTNLQFWSNSKKLKIVSGMPFVQLFRTPNSNIPSFLRSNSSNPFTSASIWSKNWNELKKLSGMSFVRFSKVSSSKIKLFFWLWLLINFYLPIFEIFHMWLGRSCVMFYKILNTNKHSFFCMTSPKALSHPIIANCLLNFFQDLKLIKIFFFFLKTIISRYYVLRPHFRKEEEKRMSCHRVSTFHNAYIALSDKITVSFIVFGKILIHHYLRFKISDKKISNVFFKSFCNGMKKFSLTVTTKLQASCQLFKRLERVAYRLRLLFSIISIYLISYVFVPINLSSTLEVYGVRRWKFKSLTLITFFGIFRPHIQFFSLKMQNLVE